MGGRGARIASESDNFGTGVCGDHTAGGTGVSEKMDYRAAAREIALNSMGVPECIERILALLDKVRQAQAAEASELLEEMVRLLSCRELVINAPSSQWAAEWDGITRKVKSWRTSLERK